MKPSRSFAIVVAALLLAGCATGSRPGGGVSLDEEWQLGSQLAAQVTGRVKVVDDAAALIYLRSVGERIHAQTKLANRPFEFEIVDDPRVDAFSLPGGHIYVTTGLIARADKADMLAGVLAHEISHVVARHVIRQIEEQEGAKVIDAVLSGQNSAALDRILAQIAAGGTMARFSRADERQADDMGLQFMAAAGFDPHGMLDVYRKLLGLDRTEASAVAQFFADHPGAQDRIDDIQGRIGKMEHTAGIVDEPEYQAVRARLGGK